MAVPILRLAFSEEFASARACSRVPGVAAINTRGGLTSIGQIREDVRPGWMTVWVGEGLHAG